MRPGASKSTTRTAVFPNRASDTTTLLNHKINDVRSNNDFYPHLFRSFTLRTNFSDDDDKYLIFYFSDKMAKMLHFLVNQFHLIYFNVLYIKDHLQVRMFVNFIHEFSIAVLDGCVV